MTSEQSKYLRARLYEVSEEKKRAISNRTDHAPLAVRVARQNVRRNRAVISRWERNHERRSDRKIKRVKRKAEQVRELILFGNEREALKALKRFEGYKP